MNKLRSTLHIALLAGSFGLALTGCGGSGSSGGSTVVAGAAYAAKTWAQLSVVSGDKQVTLGWTDVNVPVSGSTAATSTPPVTYNVYFSTAPNVTKTGKDVTRISNVASGYVHSGLQNNTTYYYVVTAVSGGVEGIESAEASATPQAALPPAPTGLSVQAGDADVTLYLPAAADSSLTYNVYWATAPGVTRLNGTKIPNADFSNQTNSFVHNALLNNDTTYYYVVTAQNSAGESALSGELSARLATAAAGTPVGVEASVGNQQLTILWSPPDALTYGYSISCQGTGADNTLHTVAVPANVAATAGGVFSETVQSLTNGAVYTCSVAATASDAGSAATGYALVSAVPEAKAPAVPVNLSAASGSQQVALSWKRDSSSDAVTYNVYWSNDPTLSKDKWSVISAIPRNSYTHTGLSAGNTYYYRVSATEVATGGESLASGQVSVTF